MVVGELGATDSSHYTAYTEVACFPLLLRGISVSVVTILYH